MMADYTIPDDDDDLTTTESPNYVEAEPPGTPNPFPGTSGVTGPVPDFGPPATVAAAAGAPSAGSSTSSSISLASWPAAGAIVAGGLASALVAGAIFGFAIASFAISFVLGAILAALAYYYIQQVINWLVSKGLTATEAAVIAYGAWIVGGAFVAWIVARYTK